MAQTDDALRDATDELYSADPDAFLPRRGELAAEAKKSGDPATAKLIAALRKPTRSAYAVNSLARSDPDGIAELVELGERLREAERTVDPRQIRELTKHRRRLVNDLTRRAFEAIGDASPSSAVRDEVVSTLTAALAEESIAAQVADGTLVKPARWEGFGSVGSPDLTLVGGTGGRASRGTDGTRAGGGATKSGPQRTSTPGASTKGMSREEREESRRQAAEQEAHRKAEEKAQREAAAEEAKRARIDEARRAADDAEEAYLLAADEEQTRVDRLRELEEQVADARKAVDEARVQLRRAEIRQRRAGDALTRLGG